MTDVTPMVRSRPIERGSERAMLESMLDFYRATVVAKVAGWVPTVRGAAVDQGLCCRYLVIDLVRSDERYR